MIAFTQKWTRDGVMYLEHTKDRLNQEFPGNEVTYIIAAQETGKGDQNYEHFQGFFRMKNPISLGKRNIGRIQKCLHVEEKNAHLEACRSSFEANHMYVTKGDGEKNANGEWINHGLNLRLVLEQGSYRNRGPWYTCPHYTRIRTPTGGIRMWVGWGFIE